MLMERQAAQEKFVISEEEAFYHDVHLVRYSYADISDSEIRCVCIAPQKQRHVGTVVACARNSGEYNALSYAWGTPFPDPDRKMFINDGEVARGYVALTENLDYALADLRDSSIEPKTFFIDQISINQHDNKEKSIQVAKMGDVYRYAKQVVTYLGPEEEGDGRAIHLLQRIVEHVGPVMEIIEAFGGITMELIDLFTRRNEIPNMMFEVAESETEDYRHLESLIYDKGWTQRLWMCQENLLNERLAFLKGPRLIDRRSVLMLPIAQALGLIFPLPKDGGEGFNQAILMAVESNEMHKKKATRSYYHLVNTYGARLGCGNPKDKIYGLLGLARDAWGIIPDYDADNLDVFVDFVQKSITKTKTLRIFNYVFQVNEGILKSSIPTNKEIWPSWTPAFQAQAPGTFVNLAAGSTIPRTKLKVNPESFEMEVQGFHVATIETVIGTFDEHSSPLQIVTPVDTLSNIINVIEKTRNRLATVQSDEVDRSLCFTISNCCSFPITDESVESWATEVPQALHLVLDAMQRARDARIQEPSITPVLTNHLEGRDATIANSLIAALELSRRSMCITKCGRPVMGTMAVQNGDIVTILLGGGEAYILRPRHDGKYLLLGPAFVFDYMSAQTLLDDEWEEELRRVLVTIITGKEYPLNLNAESAVQFRSTMQRYFTYLVGVLYVSRYSYIHEHGTDKGTEEYMAGAQQFIESDPNIQRQMIRNAIAKGPFDIHVNTFWRQVFWESVQDLIEHNVLQRPAWEQELQTFTLR